MATESNVTSRNALVSGLIERLKTIDPKLSREFVNRALKNIRDINNMNK